MQSRKTSHAILVLCVLAFIFNLHYALPVYLHSSYLAQWIPESQVGVIYTASSLFMIVAFAFMSPLLSKLGNFRMAMVLLSIEFAALLGLAYAPIERVAVISFILSFVSTGLMWFVLDIFLEHYSRDTVTGSIRGTYLTIGNLAWVIGPAAAAFILGDGGFGKVFLVSAALLIPVAFLMKHNLSRFKDPEYKRTVFFESFAEMWRDRNIWSIFVTNFLLQFFYAWMVIYMPIYLHEYVGFEWTTIGIIFSFILLPFVLVDVPLGKLADRKWGEKEILTAGFLILAVSTMAVSLIDSSSPIVWAALLFMTRLGAAAVEVMADTYFFKKVNSSRVNIISLFRSTRPIAYVIAPIIATALFTVIDMQALFLVLGFIMFAGLRYSLAIKDTK